MNESLYSTDEIAEDTIVQNHKFSYFPYVGYSLPLENCQYNNIKKTIFDKEIENCICIRKEIFFDPKQREISKYSRELYFLCHLKNLHPGIVEIYGWNEHSIFMEHVKNSSLYMMIKKNKFHFTGTQKTKIALGIAHAVNYLHKLKIVHSDLTLNNVLIDENIEPKICDFGNTKFLSEEPNRVGTIGYIAIELFKEGCKKNSTKLDVFGYGTILWDLAVEDDQPKDKDSPDKDTLNYDRIEDEKVKFLVLGCRANHPDQRFTLDYVIKLIISGEFMYPDSNFAEVREYYTRLEAQTKDISEFEP